MTPSEAKKIREEHHEWRKTSVGWPTTPNPHDLYLVTHANCFLEGLEYAEKEMEKLVEAAWDVVTHPAFQTGTKSYDKLPMGILPRMEILKQALDAHRKWKEQK